ncbi:short-chain dehydrogenase/reductase SDR [Tepidicaulis marinus]|uniref:Short-chain dehydrogenase/reductase SDR n=1 Tax=Tepidicaulis marinus TaxID=1333998 RepID=A0A081BD53_9HYPH|nr:SDR family oxidoreductase [Tepidicaulis marinus]GAK45971.1 short-chain dehydrogenase/reductase SDR [Tepidicaulis marinus]
MSDSQPGTVLITGAAKRVGRAIAEDMAARGFHVAVHYGGSEQEARDLVGAIGAKGGTAAAFQADLADAGALAGLASAAAAKLGPLTCLINNASAFEDDTLESLDEESWAQHLDTNLKAPAFLAQAFAAQLPDGAQGNIINIIDQRVWRLTPRFFSYTLSKAGLWTMTQTLAQALAPRIRVNGIGPGPTLKNARQEDADFTRQQEALLLRRGPALGEITAAIRFILESPSLTGQMIALDGGQHLAWETPDVVGIPE